MVQIDESFVITSRHEDGYLRILLRETILATVGEPCGPGGQREFCVWVGDGTMADTDEEAEPVVRFHTHHFLDVNDCWRAAVRMGFITAADWMLTSKLE